MAAGLLGEKAVTGLKREPWVKVAGTGSKSFRIIWQSETDTVSRRTGFNLVGYGCTTRIINLGRPDPIETAIKKAI